MNNLYLYKHLQTPTSFKDADVKKGIVTGYFSKFDNVDSDGDIIRKGSFTKTIKENGPNSVQPRIKHLFNHNPSQPLGVILDLKEDAEGLYYESRIGKHSLGTDFIKMVESGLISEHSIGFNTVKAAEKTGYNEITEVKLWEGSSLSGWGANSLTPLTGLKSLADLQPLFERQKAIEKFCRNSDCTDEAIEMLLIHSKQLTQIIMDSTGPVETTTPQDIKGVLETLNTFTKSLN